MNALAEGAVHKLSALLVGAAPTHSVHEDKKVWKVLTDSDLIT